MKQQPEDELPEDIVIARAVQGDVEAFGWLYQRHVQRIYSYIYYRTGSVAEAEDLTERVFMRALQHVSRYQSQGVPFVGWLYRIAHNLVANWHRDKGRRREVILEDRLVLQVSGEHPEMVFVQNQETEFLMQALRRLPEDRQHLLVLKFVEDYSNLEIGKIMGKSEGAIKSLYHRTLLALREELVSLEKEVNR